MQTDLTEDAQRWAHQWLSEADSVDECDASARAIAGATADPRTKIEIALIRMGLEPDLTNLEDLADNQECRLIADLLMSARQDLLA